MIQQPTKKTKGHVDHLKKVLKSWPNLISEVISVVFLFLGGHGPVSKYELHGGEKVHVPIGLGIGKREVVGYGNCGQENYVDHVHYPFPAIRFKVIRLIRLQ